LSKIFIIAGEGRDREELYRSLAQKGYSCSVARDEEAVSRQIAGQDPDLVLVAGQSYSVIGGIAREIKQMKDLPIIALMETETLTDVNGSLNLIDDFIIRPYDPRELNLRVERLLRKNQVETGETIRCGDLVIDMAKYEVSAGGRPVMLTFKEYELLKFLAGNAGHVFTREALLNKVWGYDYYGGDRTVDVHITRLRSKIENLSNISIETVRNIGYRLRAGT
jgi:two-component system alkaline phosphatase synthesis response regulator PhoP